MLYVGMVEEALTESLKVSPLSLDLYLRVKRAIEKGASGWASRMKASEGSVLRSLGGAVLVVEAPWGVVYFDEYSPRWKVQGHGIFWGREVARAEGEFRVIARAFFHGSDVERIEIPLLGPSRGVERVLSRAGFTKEGVLRRGGLDMTGHITDEAVWSILRREVDGDGK